VGAFEIPVDFVRGSAAAKKPRFFQSWDTGQFGDVERKAKGQTRYLDIANDIFQLADVPTLARGNKAHNDSMESLPQMKEESEGEFTCHLPCHGLEGPMCYRQVARVMPNEKTSR
jgi:hypothetical protein